jgi:YD repeat-containing protein
MNMNHAKSNISINHIPFALVFLLALALGLALNGAVSFAKGQGPTSVPDNAPISAAHSRTISYTYDGAGRLVQADYGAGWSVTYGYDDAGNLLRREVTGDSHPAYLPVIMR